MDWLIKTDVIWLLFGFFCAGLGILYGYVIWGIS